MVIFTGEYECRLDAKGRLVLPARMKANLPESTTNELMMRRGFEPCLILYPMVEYKKIFSKIAGLNEFNQEYRLIQRNFFSGNTEVELDVTGRFLIPKNMMKHAQLDKDVIVVGMGNRMELWDPKLYNEYLLKDPEEFSRLAQKYLNE